MHPSVLSTHILPNEILNEIIEYLHYNTLIHSIGLVNKQWRQCMMKSFVWKTRIVTLRGDCKETITQECIQFLKQCHITKFSFKKNYPMQLLLKELADIVTYFSFEDTILCDVTSVYNYKPDFPELLEVKFTDHDTSNVISRWISAMPILTSLSVGHLFAEVLFSKTLKHLSIRQTISQSQLITIFNQLPLLESVILNFDAYVRSSIWVSIFNITGVSDRLTSLNLQQMFITEYLSNQPPYSYTINSLKKLQLYGVQDHIDLLYNSQNTLELLSLSSLRSDISSINSLPNLRTLNIHKSSWSKILSILYYCHMTLEHLILMDIVKDEYSPVNLHFPNIKSIIFRLHTLELVPILMKNISGKYLHKLVIETRDVTNSSVIEFTEITPKLTEIRELRISEIIFSCFTESSLENIRTLDLLSENYDLDLNEKTLSLILSCKNLSQFNAHAIYHTVSATNWLDRLLKSCMYLEKIIMEGKQSGEVNFTLTDSYPFMVQLEIHFSSIQQYWKQVLQSLPNLKVLSCDSVPIDQYQHVREYLDNSHIPKVSVTHANS
jgi:hypothetical protein